MKLALLALLASAPATAQEAIARAGGDAVSTVAKDSILGALCIIFLGVAAFFYLRIERLQTKITALQEEHRKEILALSVEQSKVAAEQNLVTKQQVALIEKTLERAERRAEGSEAAWNRSPSAPPR